MKAWLILVFIFFRLIGHTVAQEEKPKLTHISKGEDFLRAGVQFVNKNQIKDSFYQTKGVNFGKGRYLINRFAIIGNMSLNLYEAREIVTPTLQEFNKKYLILLSGQLRYDFWEDPGFVSTFLQTGYGIGQFTNLEKIHIRKWEILTLGESFHFSRKDPSSLGIEFAIGLEKDNLSKRYTYPIYMGFNYYFGNPDQKL